MPECACAGRLETTAFHANSIAVKEINMNRTLQVVSSMVGALAFTTVLTCAFAAEKVGMAIDDAVITTKVKTEILEHQKLKVFDIHVDTNNGIVQLSGFVDSPTTAQRAVNAARGISGVREVKNDMVVQEKGQPARMRVRPAPAEPILEGGG
jgi:osmotically-inducible protein OsmY